jgi:hypothetical protein
MREVELNLKMRTLADALAAMRQWLDHNDCVPLDFNIERKGRVLVARVTFKEDYLADAFERDFKLNR